MILYLRKTNNIFIVDSGDDTIKNGEIVSAEIKRPRNYEFHKKFFALLNYAYECWEPGEIEYKGQIAAKSFDRFRKDIIAKAGYYDIVVNIKGEVKAEAHSISFGNMKEEEFEKLYSEVINVILKHILTNYSRDDIDIMINEIIGFS